MKNSLTYKFTRYFLSCIINIARHTYFYLTMAPDVIKDHYFEKKLNIKTDQPYYLKNDLNLYKDGRGYQPTPYRILEKTLVYLKLKPEDIFIDLGSGSGRVVFLVAMQKVKKVIGVELNNKMVDIARRNLVNFKLGGSPIEFINTDVANFKIKDENIFFMFNPFGYATFNKVMDNIKDSLLSHPRRIRIIYYSPGYRIFLFSQDWLILEKEIVNFFGRCLIWQNKL